MLEETASHHFPRCAPFYGLGAENTSGVLRQSDTRNDENKKSPEPSLDHSGSVLDSQDILGKYPKYSASVLSDFHDVMKIMMFFVSCFWYMT